MGLVPGPVSGRTPAFGRNRPRPPPRPARHPQGRNVREGAALARLDELDGGRQRSPAAFCSRAAGPSVSGSHTTTAASTAASQPAQRAVSLCGGRAGGAPRQPNVPQIKYLEIRLAERAGTEPEETG